MTSSALVLHTYLIEDKIVAWKKLRFFQIFSCQKCSSFLKQGIICQKNFVKVFNWRVGLHSFLANLMDNTNWVSTLYAVISTQEKKLRKFLMIFAQCVDNFYTRPFIKPIVLIGRLLSIKSSCLWRSSLPKSMND